MICTPLETASHVTIPRTAGDRLLLDRLHLILHGRATDAGHASQEWRTGLVHVLADARDDQLSLSSQLTLEITHLSIPGN